MTSPITVQDAVDNILAAAAVERLPVTVDTFKTGDPYAPLTGVVTTFLATAAVIDQAIALGANLIITHEPTFYTHEDTTDWLAGDPVYAAKRHLIDEHGIVIWRFHDYWHRTKPDGIATGMARLLGWAVEAAGAFTAVATIDPIPLAGLAAQLKERLGVPAIRVSGPDDLVCRRVGLALGALSSQQQIAALQRPDVDAIVCGEAREWETCEYLRDAAFFSRPKGMLVVGHAASEEAGMAYLATWLHPILPGVTITHVPCGEPLRVL